MKRREGRMHEKKRMGQRQRWMVMWGDKAKTDEGRERNLKYKTAKRGHNLKMKKDENGRKNNGTKTKRGGKV